MNIRQASVADIDNIMQIYCAAQQFMRERGNPNQWGNVYPPRDLVMSDIDDGNLRLVQGEGGEILGVFYFKIGTDETYVKIYDGEWIAPEEEYGVIHRIAVGENAHGMGVGAFCFDYCYSIIPNIRIDTHRDNIQMQKSLARRGFSYRGIILTRDGTERIAYQKHHSG